MTEPDDTKPQGFQMSSRRVVLEVVLMVLVLGGGILGVLWLSGRFAAEFTDSVPVEVDRTLGDQSARIVEATSSPCPNPGPKDYVERLAAPLVRALDDQRFSFRFIVVDDPEVNAFALPGGFVTVNRGLLESAESGEEVAAVLAHELIHVVRRHGTERMLRELGASVVLSALFGGTDIAVPAKVTHDFVSNAYDRDQEREADQKGLALLVRTGVDPRGMSRFFERLAKNAPAPPVLLSTHPDPGDRAEAAARAAQGARITTTLPSPKGLVCK